MEEIAPGELVPRMFIITLNEWLLTGVPCPYCGKEIGYNELEPIVAGGVSQKKEPSHRTCYIRATNEEKQ